MKYLKTFFPFHHSFHVELNKICTKGIYEAGKIREGNVMDLLKLLKYTQFMVMMIKNKLV